MDQQNEHQAFFNAKAAYEEDKNPTTEKKLFKAMLPYLKEAANSGDYVYFLHTLNEMDNYGFLEVSTNANQIIWSVVGLLNRLKLKSDFPVQLFEELFNLLKKLNYNRPSREHSLILNFFLKRPDHFHIFEQFISWWDIKNLRDEDFQNEQFKDVSYPALAETLYISLSKNCLAYVAESKEQLEDQDKRWMISLSHELDELYIKYPGYKMFPFYASKLRLNAGITHGVLTAFLPFARRNSSQFWVWDFLADFFPTNPDLQLALYCKGMLCRADDHMKLAIQAKLLESFINHNMFDEAHEELDKIIQVKEYNKWKIHAALLAHKSKDWYLGSSNRRQSMKTYSRFAKDGESVLFNDQPTKMAVISAYLPDRGVAFIVTEDLTNAKFKVSKYRIYNPEPGMLLQVITETVEGTVEVVQAKPATVQTHEKLFQIVEGRIKIINTGQFGIVNAVFVPQELIAQAGIHDGDPAIVKALRSYDKKKDNWGWKAISLKINY